MLVPQGAGCLVALVTKPGCSPAVPHIPMPAAAQAEKLCGYRMDVQILDGMFINTASSNMMLQPSNSHRCQQQLLPGLVPVTDAPHTSSPETQPGQLCQTHRVGQWMAAEAGYILQEQILVTAAVHGQQQEPLLQTPAVFAGCGSGMRDGQNLPLLVHFKPAAPLLFIHGDSAIWNRWQLGIILG